MMKNLLKSPTAKYYGGILLTLFVNALIVGTVGTRYVVKVKSDLKQAFYVVWVQGVPSFLFDQETKVSALDCIFFKGCLQMPLFGALALWKKRRSNKKINVQECKEGNTAFQKIAIKCIFVSPTFLATKKKWMPFGHQ